MEEDKPVIYTVLYMAQVLGISSVAVHKRLKRFGRTASSSVGSAAVYTKADLEAIRDGGARGRPPKAEPVIETAPKAKTKKTKKP